MRVRAFILTVILLATGGYNGQTAVQGEALKPHTIMIYMNGSDLESEIGAATEDLIEMLESGLRSQNADVVILTGGAKYWQNDVVPANECVLWNIEDGALFEIERIGLRNMGDPDTLADFITFGMTNFPAEKYGLVLWDHGGGAIAGYGHDEKFYDYGTGSLTLPDMDYAFRKAGLSGQKLEWLGFDSCLMATVEMALISSQYAKYLVASEDLEPGDGWDYVFLSIFNRHPRASGYTIGREIVDTFMAFYGPNSDEILTLSVVDLSKVQPIMAAMGRLMAQCSDKLLTDRSDNFTNLASRRRNTKTFGEGSPRDNQSDMVDIGDMAHQLSDLFPREAGKVLIALDDAVLYNRHNSYVPLYGLSSYYVYGGPFYESLDLYAQLDVDEAYTAYLLKFFDELTGASGQEERQTRSIYAGELQPHVNGNPVTLYRTARSMRHTQYAIPAKVNGKDCDIVVCVRERPLESTEAKVLGCRYAEGLVKQKGYDIFEPGDRVAFYYPGQGDEWIVTDEIAINEPLQLEWKVQ